MDGAPPQQIRPVRVYFARDGPPSTQQHHETGGRGRVTGWSGMCPVGQSGHRGHGFCLCCQRCCHFTHTSTASKKQWRSLEEPAPASQMLPQCRPRVRFAARNSSSDSNPCSRQRITEARSAIAWEDELAAVDWMVVWAGRCESGKVGWGGKKCWRLLERQKSIVFVRVVGAV